jgi:sulfite exporter TauE/SafE
VSYLWVGFITGLAATPHRVVICGGFALHLARVRRSRLAAVRVVPFPAGTTFTYALPGASVGALGVWVIRTGRIPAARHSLVYVAVGVTIRLAC